MPKGIYKKLQNRTLAQRFWSKVNIADLFDCWEWKASKNKLKYGTFGFDNKIILAHRFVWILIYGNIPKNFCILHKCDNPSCCNPSHLFLGTNKDNVIDKVNKDRQHHPKGTKNGQSRLTENQVIEIIKLSKTRTSKEIINMMNVSKSSVYSIVENRSWKHISRE